MAIAGGSYEAILAAGNLTLYRIFVLGGGAIGFALILRDARAWAMPARTRWQLLGAIVAGGLLAAALPAFVAGGWIHGQAAAFVVGPKTILGGLAGGFAGAAIFKRMRGILRVETADAFARGTPLMMSIGRVGCWFGHCCFGRPSSFLGVDLGDGVPRFPVQPLEAIVVFAIFLVMNELHRRGALRDRRLFVFFVLYGVARFLLEFLREPIAATPLGLGSYQWFALALVAIGAIELVKRGRRAAAPAIAI